MTSTQKSLEHKKIAIVYDWMDSWGGAERILLQLHAMFPNAEWYTSFVNRDVATWAQDIHSVHPSFIQSLPFLRRSRLLSTPLYPIAFEGFDFGEYDIVISVTSSYAKGIITRPGTLHISYMLTPTRFLWIREKDYFGKTARALLSPYIKHLQSWDTIASSRPDHIVAISQTVADRIRDVYKREADVIYPPLNTKYWVDVLRNSKPPAGGLPESYYLTVSRIKPYKKVDLAVKAFKRLKDENLVVVGSGSAKDIRKLKRMAGKNVYFLSGLSENELAYVYGHAQALIMPQEEDFGYTALEAQLCSCPVIAYKKGGATETVKHTRTGYLFDDQSARGIREAVEKFKPMAYTVQRHLQKESTQEVQSFDQETFVKKFMQYVEHAAQQ